MKNKTTKEVTLETIANSIAKMESRIDGKIEDLALATAKGFEEVNKKFEEVNKKFEEVNKKLDYTERTLSGKISGVDRRIDDLAFNRATKDEVYLLTKRVTRIEEKIGVKG